MKSRNETREVQSSEVKSSEVKSSEVTPVKCDSSTSA